MKKKNLILSLALIGVCLIFYLMIFQLPSDARVYPLFTTTLLLFFTLSMLIINYVKKGNDDGKSIDIQSLDIKQLLFVLVSSGAYVVLINIIGYMTSTLIYMLVVLFGFKIDKKKGTMIGVGFTACVYFLFKVILKVPLPTGLII